MNESEHQLLFIFKFSRFASFSGNFQNKIQQRFDSLKVFIVGKKDTTETEQI